jgi:selenocysteine lyase/cysteine desulfurase
LKNIVIENRKVKMTNLETYFHSFRNNTIGTNQEMLGNGQNKKIVYADWTASGRMYGPIEDILLKDISPYVANTHTETNFTGTSMTLAYKRAKEIIKKHVNAGETDILIASNSGMTGVVNKFQRILGLKLHEKFSDKIHFNLEDRPIVFVTHMEHHSNQTSWLETIAEVAIINACGEGKVDLDHLKSLLEKYKDRKSKIAAITSCSNVTGLFTPYHEIAKIMHQHGGLCFVDFACSAPYININMHPEDPEAYLDAIYFSPHKFLGGPGSNGVLIFNSKLYSNRIPDHPGGGTVDWTNPWGEHKYHEEIEAREDGGTPGFLQTLRIALAIQLKEKMGVSNIEAREHEILDIAWKKFESMEKVHVFAEKQRDRLPIFSFIIEGVHFNLAVKLLNDKFGVQVRGGCSCAGTYGHYLFEISDEKSHQVTSQINVGDLSGKPGWVRISFHPTMTNVEVELCLDAIHQVSMHHEDWAKDYKYNRKTNEFNPLRGSNEEEALVDSWFHQIV